MKMKMKMKMKIKQSVVGCEMYEGRVRRRKGRRLHPSCLDPKGGPVPVVALGAIFVLVLVLGRLADGSAVAYADVPVHVVTGNVAAARLHYVAVQLGTPPSPQNLLLSTASADVVVENSGCELCVSGMPPYDPLNSLTSKPLPCSYSAQCLCQRHSGMCGFELDWLGGTDVLSGVFFTDLVTLAAVDVPVNC